MVKYNKMLHRSQ